MKGMKSSGYAKEPSRCGIRHTRFPWQLRAAGAAVGFIGLCWLIDYVVIPAVLWTVLVLADGISVALGMGSVL